MAYANKAEGLYIELDALLDTRLGTIAKLSNEAAQSIVSSDSYFSRDMDLFEGVNQIEYLNSYLTRDKMTLKKSVMTNAITFLKSVVRQLILQAVSGPTHDRVFVHVNTYPYAFSQDEVEELEAVVLYRLNEGIDPDSPGYQLLSVQRVHFSTKELTPQHCKSHYGAMFMYDPWNWMNLHSKTFEKVRLPEVLLYCPKLYFNKRPSPEEIKDIKSQAPNAPDVFTATEMQTSPLVGLTYLDVAQFSSSIRLSDQAA
jgi:hypothetical protein